MKELGAELVRRAVRFAVEAADLALLFPVAHQPLDTVKLPERLRRPSLGLLRVEAVDGDPGLRAHDEGLFDVRLFTFTGRDEGTEQKGQEQCGA